MHRQRHCWWYQSPNRTLWASDDDNLRGAKRGNGVDHTALIRLGDEAYGVPISQEIEEHSGHDVALGSAS
jgi:hypothetical protein